MLQVCRKGGHLRSFYQMAIFDFIFVARAATPENQIKLLHSRLIVMYNLHWNLMFWGVVH